jgi:hypothetical protein
VILGLRGRGAGAAREASPVPGLFVASLCASYVVSAFAVSAIGRPSVTSAVPAVVLGLVLLVVIASRAAPQRAAAAG